ncbi:hypothetical protein [Streptococcus sp. CSL10205-OR2]|uniref:hypothetical protein n=1 Tax=Streptococcus sp. CSL10205-OR2 TaxID=2980558 RepID=UPI0021DAC8A6|nr:hypothetical protein [Streptococcus sp. CSL10205-OR2]MCU9533722.1 hypothetical protein [Streptococcus sp. CSL10205-OR2]
MTILLLRKKEDVRSEAPLDVIINGQSVEEFKEYHRKQSYELPAKEVTLQVRDFKTGLKSSTITVFDGETIKIKESFYLKYNWLFMLLMFLMLYYPFASVAQNLAFPIRLFCGLLLVILAYVIDIFLKKFPHYSFEKIENQ